MIKAFIKNHPHVVLLNIGASLIAIGGNMLGHGAYIYPISLGVSLIVSAICLQTRKDLESGDVSRSQSDPRWRG